MDMIVTDAGGEGSHNDDADGVGRRTRTCRWR